MKAGPGRKYPPISAADYLARRVNANFKAYRVYWYNYRHYSGDYR
jgi:hypothetical protein